MKFRNTHPENPLDFELAGMRYKVPLGGLVEIEDKWAYAPKECGLPLEPVADDVAGPIVRGVPDKARPIRMPDGVELTDAAPGVEADEEDAAAVDELPVDVSAALGKKAKKK